MILDIIQIGAKLLDKVIPDEKERAKAKLELLQQEQMGELKEMHIAMSAINTEGSSGDKWTSRARPGFLYVIYILILSSIPMGVLHAFNPVMANNVVTGFSGWLAAIPDPLYTLFGAGYLGYATVRTYDKAKARSQ